MLFWIMYGAIVLLVSGLIGLHLGRFREAYTEMTGMMAGMTMGMINGFLLGYVAAALSGTLAGVTATVSLFWGNVFGILFGVLLGVFFGRAGGLMGMMDGGMGGMMGGSMGAMLAAMLTLPEWAMFYTAILLLLVYIVSMVGLVVLIEKSAPGHEALHIFAPYFTRAVAEEAAEEYGSRQTGANGFTDHYSFLGIDTDASKEEITEAYIGMLHRATVAEMEQAERALLILTDPARREAYDRGLEIVSIRPDCCPPPRRKKPAGSALSGTAAPAITTPSPPAPAPRASTAKVMASGSPTRSGTATVTVRSTAAEKPGQNGSARQQAHAKNGRKQPPPKSGVGPGAIIGGGLAILVLAGVGLWLLLSQASGAAAGAGAYTDNGQALPQEFVTKIKAEAVDAPVGAGGKQILAFAVNGTTSSYNPSVVRVKKGVPVHFDLKVEGADPG